MIRLEGVSHSYRDGWRWGTRVLDTGDLSLEAVGITALIGANGSGKSTFLRLLSGHVRPKSGAVRFGDKDVFFDFEELKSQIHYLSDKARLYSEMTGEAHLRLFRAKATEWNLAIEEQLRTAFAIPLRRSVRQMSRGEQVKLRLMLSLPAKPRLLLIDELTNDLDTESRKLVFEKLKAQCEREEARVFIATNILPDVEKFASHVLVLRKGKVVKQAAIRDLTESLESLA